MSKQPTCSRLWQAEAIEDGRLQGPDRDTFLRHAAGCADCSRELAALSQLRELGAGFATQKNTELDHRRQRQSLLRRADDFMVGAERERTAFGGFVRSVRPSRWAAAFAVAACVLVAALWMTRRGPGPASVPPPAALTDAPRFEIQATAGGHFHVLHAGPELLVGVTPGTYAAHVQKLTPAQRFVMQLPDGELEVHGTRFVLVVAPSSTQSVSVSEGLVALRIHGQHEVLLHPGDAWSAPAPTAAPQASSGPGTRSESIPGAAPALSAPPKAPKPDAGAAFARAMTAYSRGDYAESERLFLAFERDFPRDARTEDSAFLRVTARARRGDTAGAQALARDYLRRFPSGLRRVEAERLSH